MIISSSNSERELLGIINKLDKNKQLSTQCCVNVWPDGGAAIVIIIMQPCLWNAVYAIM